MLEVLSSFALNVGVNIFSNRMDNLLTNNLSTKHRWKLTTASWKSGDIRVSISYIYRIKVDGKYLLVKGNRISHQYQPVGGVRKFYSKALSEFEHLGVKDDNCQIPDAKNKNDLRLRVPAKNIIKFLNWYSSGKNREIDQFREFKEELIDPGLLTSQNFCEIHWNFLYAIPTLHFSQHYQCQELLCHEVYEMDSISNEQLSEFRKLINSPSEEYIWVDEELILSLGHDKRLGLKPFQISEHSRLVLGKDQKLFQ